VLKKSSVLERKEEHRLLFVLWLSPHFGEALAKIRTKKPGAG
jgi:hypothetical protein